eukprot:640250-Amphidinium_carterae.1
MPVDQTARCIQAAHCLRSIGVGAGCEKVCPRSQKIYPRNQVLEWGVINHQTMAGMRLPSSKVAIAPLRCIK